MVFSKVTNGCSNTSQNTLFGILKEKSQNSCCNGLYDLPLILAILEVLKTFFPSSNGFITPI
jgi:hypothetical protein